MESVIASTALFAAYPTAADIANAALPGIFEL